MLFDQQCPAPGFPSAARVIDHSVLQPGSGRPLALDEAHWGLDHRTLSILKPVFRKANIQVRRLSMDYRSPAAKHFVIGQQLVGLRERGVLILDSGNTVQNLRSMRRDAADNQAYDWAL